MCVSQRLRDAGLALGRINRIIRHQQFANVSRVPPIIAIGSVTERHQRLAMSRTTYGIKSLRSFLPKRSEQPWLCLRSPYSPRCRS